MPEEGDGGTVVSGEKPSEAVIRAVSEAEGVPSTALAPPDYPSLHEVIDPEALNALFETRTDGTGRQPGRVSFQYCGYEVQLTSDGEVRLDSTDDQ
jgi:hypothetical protein